MGNGVETFFPPFGFSVLSLSGSSRPMSFMGPEDFPTRRGLTVRKPRRVPLTEGCAPRGSKVGRDRPRNAQRQNYPKYPGSETAIFPAVFTGCSFSARALSPGPAVYTGGCFCFKEMFCTSDSPSVYMCKGPWHQRCREARATEAMLSPSSLLRPARTRMAHRPAHAIPIRFLCPVPGVWLPLAQTKCTRAATPCAGC